jgi:Bacteriophage tail sheath protein
VPTYLSPGVYIEELADAYEPRRFDFSPPPPRDGTSFPQPRWLAEHSIAAFVGFASQGPFDTPILVTRWTQFENTFGEPLEQGYLSDAVRGFFANGGRNCYVLRVEVPTSKADADVFGAGNEGVVRGWESDGGTVAGLARLEAVPNISIVCIPDVMSAYVQRVLDGEGVQAIHLATIMHCERMGDRIAILDSLPGLSAQDVVDWRYATQYDSKFATLYYPWVKMVRTGGFPVAMVPPSGHVAGVFARTDLLRGPQQTPANQPIAEAVDVETSLLHSELDVVNSTGVNVLLPTGRGVLVFGSRTLSSDPVWRYVRRRRLMNFISRNIRHGTEWVVFERADDERVWARIRSDLDDLLGLLWRSGALWGGHRHDAYSLKCDSETNPPDVTGSSQVVVECSVAPDPTTRLSFRVVYFCD